MILGQKSTAQFFFLDYEHFCAKMSQKKGNATLYNNLALAILRQYKRNTKAR